MSSSSSFGGFIDPPREFGPVPFWFLNEKLDRERLRWQVQQMHEQHVFGAVMHARPGLVTPYLSEEWFEMIGHILDKARSLGMYMWIYDDYPWASGMAEYRVPRLHTDFRIRAVQKLSKNVQGPQTLEWDISTELPPDAAEVISAVMLPMLDDQPVGTFADVSGKLEGRTLKLEVPEGVHAVEVFYERLSFNPYGDQFGTLPVTDLMHPLAIQKFIDLTHREYQRRFPEHMGTTVTAAFTDEPPADTPGWSTVFAEEFIRRKGYDIRPMLPMLWRDCGPSTGKVRLDYSDVAGQLYEESFFGALEQWCDETGTASSGHLLLEETLPFHVRFMGDYFRSMRRLHYPGIDYIFPGQIPAVTCKLAASVAKLYGRERVMSECFALTGWQFDFTHMKWMTDWQLVNGVNLLVPHAFFYSSSETEPIPDIPDDLGFRWYDCPPSMFFQQPYWQYYRTYADYLRRSCYLITRGEQVAEIALYYPIETAQANFIPSPEAGEVHAFKIPGTWMTADYLWDGNEVEQTDAHFRCAANLMRNSGLDYDIVDDDSLRDAVVDGGRIVIRGRSYSAVVLPRTQWIEQAVYRNLEQFAEGGGLLIATGCTPGRAVDGPEADWQVRQTSKRLFGTGLGFETAPVLARPDRKLADLLRENLLGDFECDTDSVFCQHRRLEGGDLFYIVNHSPSDTGTIFVSLKADGAAVLMDALTGVQHRLVTGREREGWQRLSLRLAAWESVFVRFSTDQAEMAEEPPLCQMPDRTTICDLPGPWVVSRDETPAEELVERDLPPIDYSTLPHHLETQDLVPWEQIGLQSYSGAVVYETTFEIGDCSGSCWLDLGEVGVAAEAWLNGVRLGVRLWTPYVFDVTKCLKQGGNTLRVRVANTAANRMAATYGSGAVPTSASAQQVASYAQFQDGQLRSGLMGPVRVVRADDTRR